MDIGNGFKQIAESMINAMARQAITENEKDLVYAWYKLLKERTEGI